MNQPSMRLLAMIIGIGALVLFRFIPEYDPLAKIISDLTKTNQSPAVSVEEIKLISLEQENAQLKAELGFKNSNQNSSYLVANVLNKTTASFRKSIKINRGSKDGIKNNQPVLSEGIMIGIVSNTESDFATVLLVGDPDVQVPVVIGSAEGLVKSQAGGLVVDRVVGLSKADQDKPVLTSGLGGFYPPGLALGKLGAELPRDIFERYVLDTPINLAEIRFVTVKL